MNELNIVDIIGSEFTLVQLSENLYTTKEWDSLRIFVDTNSWYRFSKGIGGDVISWIYYRKLDPDQLKDLPKFIENKPEESQIQIVNVQQLYGRVYYPAYLKNRNISYDTYLKYNIEYFNNAIGIPLLNLNNKRIGVQLRNIDKNAKQRYYFYLLDKKPALFPLNEIKDIQDKVLLVEGTFSVLRWNQVINNNKYKIFGTLGNQPNADIKELLNGIPENKIYCVYDPDDGGKVFRKKIKQLLPDCNCLSPTVKLDDMTDYQLHLFFKRYIK